MPQPLGTAIPHPPIYALANFDPSDITGSIGRQLLGDPNGPLQFPTVNRKDKRNSMISRGREPMPPLPPALAIAPVQAQVGADVEAAVEAPFKQDLMQDKVEGRFDPYAEYQFGAVAEPLPPAEPAKSATPAPRLRCNAAQRERAAFLRCEPARRR